MKERTERLKAMFNEPKFSVYFLRKLYREHGITYKKVKIGKKPKE